MSGEQRISLGEITQGSTKGKGMESALGSALNNPTPLKTKKAKKK